MQKFDVTIVEPYRITAIRRLPRRELAISLPAQSPEDATAMARRLWRRWFGQDVPAHARLTWAVDPAGQAKTEALRYAALRHAAVTRTRPRLAATERASATHAGLRRISKASGVERDWRGRDRRGFSGLDQRRGQPLPSSPG